MWVLIIIIICIIILFGISKYFTPVKIGVYGDCEKEVDVFLSELCFNRLTPVSKFPDCVVPASVARVNFDAYKTFQSQKMDGFIYVSKVHDNPREYIQPCLYMDADFKYKRDSLRLADFVSQLK